MPIMSAATASIVPEEKFVKALKETPIPLCLLTCCCTSTVFVGLVTSMGLIASGDETLSKIGEDILYGVLALVALSMIFATLVFIGAGLYVGARRLYESDREFLNSHQEDRMLGIEDGRRNMEEDSFEEERFLENLEDGEEASLYPQILYRR